MFDVAYVSLVQLSDCFVASIFCGQPLELTVVIVLWFVGRGALSVEEAVIMLKALRAVHQTSRKQRTGIDHTVVVDARCEPDWIEKRMYIFAARVERFGRCQSRHDSLVVGECDLHGVLTRMGDGGLVCDGGLVAYLPPTRHNICSSSTKKVFCIHEVFT